MLTVMRATPSCRARPGIHRAAGWCICGARQAESL